MDYQTEQEIKKIWRTLRCKANCGSVGNLSVIEITKEAFLTLVNSNSLQYPATYKITDIDNGLWIDTLNGNTFNLDATISLFVPDYTPSGTNLGQMDANTIPSVASGEKVIWGDHYWSNTTGIPVTPTIVDFQEIIGLTQEVKISGSSYEIINYNCLIDKDLNILSVTSNTKSVWFINTVTAEAGFSGLYIYFPLNNSNILGDNLLVSANNKGQIGFLCPYIDAPLIVNNTAKVNTLIIEGENNEFSGNTSTDLGSYSAIKLVNTCRFKDNTISGATYNSAQIGYIELFDNCEIIGNTIINNGIIWDLRTGENCRMNSNEINGGTDDNVLTGFADIDQMQQDEVNGNIINGEGVFIEMINQLGWCKFNDNTFNGKMTERWSGFQMLRSEITDNTINSNNLIWKDIWLTDAKLRNATDIQIQNCTFESVDLDLTGFTQDIVGETIQSGKGWFAITHNFATTPVHLGSSVLYNIIPNGARVTNIKTFGTATGGAGAELAFGINTDAPTLLPAAVLATVNAGQTYNSVSKPATANRSLNITAGVNNVTGGEVTVLVEFVL